MWYIRNVGSIDVDFFPAWRESDGSDGGFASTSSRSRSACESYEATEKQPLNAADGRDEGWLSKGITNSRNPRHFDTIEGGRVYQALHIDSKSVLDALCRVKKCFRHSI